MISARQTMYIQRKTEARSRNYCCRRKAVNVTYYWSVSVVRVWKGGGGYSRMLACACAHVASFTQHAKLIRHIILSHGLSGSTTLFDIINGKIFGTKSS
jgi:hypothetical protein